MNINEIQDFYITNVYTLAIYIIMPNMKQNGHTVLKI